MSHVDTCCTALPTLTLAYPLCRSYACSKQVSWNQRLQMSTKHMQPFSNHHLPHSSRPPKEECTPQCQYLTRFAYHLHWELPSCQSKDARCSHGRVWGSTCGWQCWIWASGGWDCNSGSWYANKDNGGWEWAGQGPTPATECWNFGRLGHRWVFFVREWDWLIRRNFQGV